MSNATTPVGVPIDPLTGAFGNFDSPDSRETIIYLSISIVALVAIGLALKAIYWVSDQFRYPGWQIWSITTRQRLAVVWTTSFLSLLMEAVFLLSSLFSISTFVYVTILIANEVPKGKTRSEILHIPWLYWTEFVLTIIIGFHLLFRLYTSKNGLLEILDPSIVCEVIAGIPLLTSPFRGQFAWNFQYLRVIRLHYTFSFVSHHPSLALSGKMYQLLSYVLSTICMLFGAGGFFFVLENRYFNANGLIGDMVDAMYYVVITVSTTGYGDISPKTVLGRIGAILLALSALIYIPLRVAKLVQILRISTSGVVKNPGNHIIVSAWDLSDFETFVGEFFHPDRKWSETTLALMAPNSEVEVELHSLVRLPRYEMRVQSLQGSLANPSFYPNYYLDTCKAVILMADKKKGALGDSQTLVTAMSLMKRYPSLPLYIQVHTKASKETAIARGIKNTMCIEELRLGILVQNTLNPCFAPFILNLMRTSGEDAHVVSPSNQWIEEYLRGEGYECYNHASLTDFEGLSFAEAALYIYKKFGIIMFGIVTRTERLISKTPSPTDPTESSATRDTDSGSLSAIASSIYNVVPLAKKHKPAPPQQLAAMSFDRDRRKLESGERTSIDLEPGAHASLDGIVNMNEFELIVDWKLELNPGPEYVIREGQTGLVFAKNISCVDQVCCEDLELVQSIAQDYSTWGAIPDDEKDLITRLARKKLWSSGTTEVDQDDAESSDSDSDYGDGKDGGNPNELKYHKDELEKTKLTDDNTAKNAQIGEESGAAKRIRDKNTAAREREAAKKAHKALKALTDAEQDMTYLSRVDRLRIPTFLKKKYDLVKDKRLDLDQCTLPSVEGLFRGTHILVCGEWHTDMYNLVLGLRLKELGEYGKLRPLVFLSPEQPSPSLWAKVCMFSDLFCVIGSSLDAADLKRAGAIDAYRILVLESTQANMESHVTPGSRSLTTFLILQKLTTSHVTIELLTPGSLDLLLKGHAQLYSKKPDSKSPLRPDYVAARSAYKELSNFGPSVNPYYASGNVILDSFLDSLMSLTYFNEQLLPVIAAFLSPTAFHSATVEDITAMYPYLIETKVKRKKKRRHHRHHHSKHEPPSDAATPTPKDVEMEDISPHHDDDGHDDDDGHETLRKTLTFGALFEHFFKYAGSVVLAIQRVGSINVVPYIITCPREDLELAPEDMIYFLVANELKPISSLMDHSDPSAANTGSIVDIITSKKTSVDYSE